MVRLLVLIALVVSAVRPGASQPAAPSVDPLHRPLDQVLDVYVRDGYVYYNAIRQERSRLDQYVASLNGVTAQAHASGTPAQRLALWINAYNALVLQTVATHYPIRRRSPDFPPGSIRQIPGAFERDAHRVAGRTVSLDEIEKDLLAPLGDPRAFLALGRGSVGGGRLRSEAYDAARLEAQLAAVAAESLKRHEIVRIDPVANELIVSPLFSWRESVFVVALADRAADVFKERSPLERAVLALIEPHLVRSEAQFLEQNAFRMVFGEFDWRLNDLSTRTP